MELATTLDDLARGRAAVHDAADRLATHRETLDRRVRSLTAGGWTGVAAESFDQAWADWRAGAERVEQGLTAMADLLGAVRLDVATTDASARTSLGSVAARVVDRLG